MNFDLHTFLYIKNVLYINFSMSSSLLNPVNTFNYKKLILSLILNKYKKDIELALYG